nr:hypothetical protein [uncultured Undibacterium sp.]
MFKKISVFQSFVFAVLILCFAAFVLKKVRLQGDLDEYVSMSAALSAHYSPDIQATDLRRVQELVPGMKERLQSVENGIESGEQVPKAGFYRGNNGRVYAIHFFTYSALAAIPFQIFQLTGLPPVQSFLLVNLVFIFILALSFFKFFESSSKAFFALFLFFLCGGWNYCFWLGPETMSAVSVCAAIICYFGGRHLASGILLGLSATQNPPVILALFFIPLLRLVSSYLPDRSFLANFKLQFSRKMLAGLGISAVFFLCCIGFNLWAFGVPNIIAKVATSTSLIGWDRLISIFFDLNQGMLIGFAGIWGGIVILMFQSLQCRQDFIRYFVLLLVTVAFSVAMALPALTTGNWNSGAVGMMRYAFWAGMPFLALFLILWKKSQRSNILLLSLLVFTQLLCSKSSLRYSEVEFSPIAQVFLRHFPDLYNPEPEIFVERMAQKDGAELSVDKFYAFDYQGKRNKTLFHHLNADLDRQLCGEGLVLGLDNQSVSAAYGWRYLNGSPHCIVAKTIDVEAFSDPAKVRFDLGWSKVELAGGIWNGRWSDGLNSVITIPLPPNQKARGVKLIGHYFGRNTRTRILVNDKDLGWFDLAAAPMIQFPVTSSAVKLDLRHEYPHDPQAVPDFPDSRRLSVFLQSLVIY